MTPSTPAKQEAGQPEQPGWTETIKTVMLAPETLYCAIFLVYLVLLYLKVYVRACGRGRRRLTPGRPVGR